MDLDPTAVGGWARRDEAEGILRYLLGELAQPTLTMVRERLGSGPDDEVAAASVWRGQSTVVYPWRNQMRVKYRMAAEVKEERFRLQFLASDGKPYFTVEARYNHPRSASTTTPISKTPVASSRKRASPATTTATATTEPASPPAERWLQGSRTLDCLLESVGESVDPLARSGIFGALARRTPSTPSTPDEPEPEDR